MRAMWKVKNGDDPMWKDRRARGWCHLLGTKLQVISFEEMQAIEDKRQLKLDEIKKKKMAETMRLENERKDRIKRDKEEKERKRKEETEIKAPKLPATGLDVTKLNKGMLLEAICNYDMVAKNEQGESKMDYDK